MELKWASNCFNDSKGYVYDNEVCNQKARVEFVYIWPKLLNLTLLECASSNTNRKESVFSACLSQN